MNLPLFIVFEGIDGSGKSTLCNSVFNHYSTRNIPVVKYREPSTGRWGAEIREKLSGRTMPDAAGILDLFILDRRDDVERNLVPALKNNKLVLLDRYYYSNAAYQGAMGIDPATIIDMNRSQEFPEPNRVFFIDVSPETALKRIEGRISKSNTTDVFEKKQFLESVRKIYHKITDEKFIILDGLLSPGELSKSVIENIEKLLQRI